MSNMPAWMLPISAGLTFTALQRARTAGHSRSALPSTTRASRNRRRPAARRQSSPVPQPGMPPLTPQSVVDMLERQATPASGLNYLVVTYTRTVKNRLADILTFDLVGPLDTDQSLEATNILDGLGYFGYSVHNIAGDLSTQLTINPTMEHWAEQLRNRLAQVGVEMIPLDAFT